MSVAAAVTVVGVQSAVGGRCSPCCQTRPALHCTAAASVAPPPSLPAARHSLTYPWRDCNRSFSPATNHSPHSTTNDRTQPHSPTDQQQRRRGPTHLSDGPTDRRQAPQPVQPTDSVTTALTLTQSLRTAVMNGDPSTAALQGEGAANDGVWSALLSKATRKAKENNATIVLLGQYAGWTHAPQTNDAGIVLGRGAAGSAPSRLPRFARGSRIWGIERAHAFP